MSSLDLVGMIVNITHSLPSVQRLLTGFAYLLGILFFITAVGKLKKIGESRAGSHSQEKMFQPMAYLLIGAVLFYIPTGIGGISNTIFGTGTSIIAYSALNAYDIIGAMGLMVQTAGVIWFVRGCVLLVGSSEPGVQHGPKGLAFLIAGILAINFHMTLATTNSIITMIVNYTMNPH